MIQYQNNNKKQITFSFKVLHFNTIQLPGTVFDLFTWGIKLCEVESNYSVFSSFLFIDVIWYMYTVYFVYRSSHGSIWNDVTGGHKSSIHKLYVLILLCQTFTRDRRCSTTRGCLYSRWWGKRIQQEGEICGFHSRFYNQNTKICFFQMSKIHVICGSTQDDVHVGELLIREIQV